jgi:hypothetical protein
VQFIQNNYNTIFFSSVLLNPDNATLGLSNMVVSLNQGNLTCSFTRDNANSYTGYYQITPTSTPFFLAAYGAGIYTLSFFLQIISSSTQWGSKIYDFQVTLRIMV